MRWLHGSGHCIFHRGEVVTLSDPNPIRPKPKLYFTFTTIYAH